MSFFKKPIIILLLLTLSAFGLRVWHLNDLPKQLNRDEAAIGLNAKLLATTGKDEWGKSWPIALESFGDYKLPGYVWLTMLAGQIFGWQDWVVRLPSALAGSLLPLLVFVLVKRLGKSTREAYWVAAMLVILPVNWFYSRMGFEANVALDFLIGWLILVASKKQSPQNHWLDLGLIVLTIVMILTYNTPLLLLPFLLSYLIFYWDFRYWKSWSLTWIFMLIITVGSFYVLSQLFGQKSSITLFTDPTVWTHFVEQRAHLAGVQRVFESSWYGYLSFQMFSRFFATWSPYFLVTHGGTHPWHSLPGTGHLLWIQYLLALFGFGVGIVSCFKKFSTVICAKEKILSLKNFFSNSNVWLVYLTFISLLPAIITTDAPHATRSLLFFVLLTIWAGKAIEWLLHHFARSAGFIGGIIAVVLIFQAGQYGYQYFVNYPNHQDVFQPGLSAIIQTLEKNYPDKNQTIAVVGDGYSYAIWAWYAQLSPQRFFGTIIKQLPDRIGFRYGEHVDRYHFIMQSADRSPSEKVLVEWSENRWQIKTF